MSSIFERVQHLEELAKKGEMNGKPDLVALTRQVLAIGREAVELLKEPYESVGELHYGNGRPPVRMRVLHQLVKDRK